MRRLKLSINCRGVLSVIARVYTFLAVIQYRVFVNRALKLKSAKSKHIRRSWPLPSRPSGIVGG